MEIESVAIDTLQKKQIPFELYVHKKPPKSLEEAAQERNQDINQVIRSILFRITGDQYCMVCIAGKQQIDWKKLRNLMETNRLALASKSEVLDITGYQIGSVTPFGLSDRLPVFLDPTCFNYEIMSIGSGIRGVAILISSNLLNKALSEAKIVDLAQK